MVTWLLSALFLNVSWFWHFIARFVLFQILLDGSIFHRMAQNDFEKFAVGWATATFAFIVAETSVYINVKAQVKLFVQVKLAE